MFSIKDYVLSAIIIILTGVLTYKYIMLNNLEDQITKLEKKNSDLMISMGNCKSNNARLKNSILKQNQKVKDYELDVSKAQKEIDRLNSLPPKVKYKTLEKIIYREDSNECKDIKNMLDSIRTYKP